MAVFYVFGDYTLQTWDFVDGDLTWITDFRDGGDDFEFQTRYGGNWRNLPVVEKGEEEVEPEVEGEERPQDFVYGLHVEILQV
ncbi:hypothetical protein L2E82_49418 [Cichorium intybus]|uniref:Uncharacterized protein n=1 Tax=Cichorium intybus TaxID=13427 RepID=A0ACB8Z0P4_CICIN|nr:hypothetical protein L2E82_49418 [Cichorium intybus]